MKNVSVVIALVAGLVGGLLGVKLFMPKAASVAKTETVYERVMRTKTLRCGYALYDPLLKMDPTTKQLSGVFYDVTIEMARQLGLKVEWTQEIGYGEIATALNAHKFDMFCTGAVITPARASAAWQTVPLYYTGLVTWVRVDDHRFDGGLEKLNDPAVKLSTRDGDLSDNVADNLFPKATKVATAQLADFSQAMIDVKTGKADATFFDTQFGEKFLKYNPGSMRSIFPDKPVLMGPIAMMLPRDEPSLKNMVDMTLLNMRLTGQVDAMLRKYVGTAPYFWHEPMLVRY